MFQYHVDEDIALELLLPHHARQLYHLVEQNRAFLTPWVDVERLHSLDDARGYIEWALRALASGDGMRCAVVYRGEHVGRLSYHDTEWHHQVTELGYWLAEDYTGRGIMTRAIRGLLDYAFFTLGMRRAEIWTSEKNLPSQRVAERVGFRQEATMRQMTALSNAEFGDFLIYGLLADEWATPRQTGRASGEFAMRIDEETELRLLMPHHAEILYAAVEANRAHLAPWIGHIHRIHSVADALKFINGELQSLADGKKLRCGIWHQGVFAGQIGLVDANARTGQVEIGYWIDAAHSGRGLVTRTSRALTDACFKLMDANNVTIRCAVDNGRSRAVAERLGFHQDGILCGGHAVAGVLQDIVVYSMLAKEWQ